MAKHRLTIMNSEGEFETVSFHDVEQTRRWSKAVESGRPCALVRQRTYKLANGLELNLWHMHDKVVELDTLSDEVKNKIYTYVHNFEFDEDEYYVKVHEVTTYENLNYYMVFIREYDEESLILISKSGKTYCQIYYRL